MHAADLTYGDAHDCHTYLMSANDVSVSDLVSVAANAMNRIDALERRIDRLETSLKIVVERLDSIAKYGVQKPSNRGW